MSGIEQFEALLKETVLAKRLSASKMKKLEEIALKNFENDTQLVAILYRTHKSLPHSSKVSSLYVFDALAGAAKKEVMKRKLGADGATGNAASFLSKMGGVVDGLVRDMQNPGIVDGKEKSKKVLDIWIKGSVFPPDLLTRLGSIVKGTDQVSKATKYESVRLLASEAVHSAVHARPAAAPAQAEPMIMPPPMSPTHSQSPVTPVPQVDAQATLLALLAQAQAAKAGPAVVPTFPQTPVNTQGAQLAAAQFVLHQLTQSAALPPALNVASPPILSARSGNDYAAGHHSNRRSRSPNSHDPRRPPPREASRQDRYASPENGRNYDSHSDHRSYPSRAPARGSYRGRGDGRRRWDDRDRDRDSSYRDRDYSRDRSPPPRRRGGRSRSRSPPPPRSSYGDRRDERPRPSYRSPPPSSRRNAPLPPSRPSMHSSQARPSENAPSVAGKDEFGRDIRSPSPVPEQGSANGGVVAQPPPFSGSAFPTTSSANTHFSNAHDPTNPNQPQASSIVDTADTQAQATGTSVSDVPPSFDATPTTASSTSASGSSLSQISPFVSSSDTTMSSIESGSNVEGNVNGNGNGHAQTNDTQTNTRAAEAGASGSQSLDNFNFATFDPASPASWEALGKLWQSTYGCVPVGPELMQFVMSMGTIRPAVGQGTGAVNSVGQQQQQQQPLQTVPQYQRHQPQEKLQQVQTWTSGDEEKLEQRAAQGYGRGGRGGSRGWRGGFGGGRGRGGGAYSSFSHQDGSWGGYDDGPTDAIVLGGGDSSPQQNHNGASSYYGSYSEQGGYDGGGGRGKMQRSGY